ncbi:MAG: glycosyltransferase [Planctomycetaceae bacterium]|nr:glycosyltransferase [Planctomycetaceae bacterium]
MPCYNSAKTLGALLESIAKLAPPPREVIVVDDCSTDDSAAIAAGFADVTCLRTADNGGPSVSRNVGARHARSELLLFIDSDCEILTADCIAKHIQAHAGHPRSLVVGAVSSIAPDTYVGRANGYLQCFENIPFRGSGKIKRAHEMPGMHFSVRRSDFEEIGGFDEELRAGEDALFHVCAQARGIKALRIGEAVVGHHDDHSAATIFCKYFNYGKTRLTMKAKGAYGWRSFLLPDSVILLSILAPLVTLGLTAKVVYSWLPWRPAVLLHAPLLLVYNLGFAGGAVACAWQQRRSRRQ